NVKEIQDYVFLIEKEFEPLRGSALYKYALCGLNTAQRKIPLYVFKAKIKMLVSDKYLKFARIAGATFLRYRNRVFC
ncbi:MAG: hypothetical protein ABII25_04045, partial [bacterium]